MEIQVKLSNLFGPDGSESAVSLADVDEAIAFIYRQLDQAEFPASDLNALLTALAQSSDRGRVAYVKKTFDLVRGTYGNLQYARNR